VPASLELPSFSVPSKTLPSVSLLLPNLTSLPSIVVPAELPKVRQTASCQLIGCAIAQQRLQPLAPLQARLPQVVCVMG
jgi:hypothetical protein